MKKTYLYRASVFALIIGIGLLWGGCTKEKITNTEEYGSLLVSVPFKTQAATALTFELIVEGRDFGSKVFPLSQIRDTLVGRADSIPFGRDRLVTVRAFDDLGSVIYRGSDVVDIIPGRTVAIDITLRPQAETPMFTITPRSQSLFMNDTIFVDVNVFNIPDLSGITFNFIRNFSPSYVASVVKGDQYDDQVTLSYTLANDITTINVAYANRLGRIVDSLGNAHLATLMIPTYADWGFDTATVVMQTEYLSGVGIGGGELLIEVISDDAEAELTWPLLFIGHKRD